ncbi:MAG: serine/threonine protein kinase, partial [Myxococcales bacterium]|nr:serine/threonine protein kinase [Myxococcales bacterium]
MAIEEPQDLVPGERIAGRYRIESLLGRGGMGTVYAATNDLTTRPVALKAIPLGPELHSPMVKRFRAEARAMGRISHPNVIEVFDLFQERKQLFLVMERLHGRVLADAIEGRRMPFVDACRVIWDALQGIDAAHAKGVVHRDLKPENIFLCEDDRGVLVRVKVLDFGVAKFAAGVGTTLTATGALVGTPYYMSPE